MLAGACCTLTLLCGIAGSAAAQTIATGVLQGEVRDQSNATMTDVSVMVRASEGGASRVQATSREGTFKFGLLPPGTYSVLVERFGYRPKRIDNVQLRAGRSIRIDVTLQTAPPPVEAVEVTTYQRNSGATRAGVSQYLTTISPLQSPWYRRELTELAALSTMSTPTLEIEGLPGWMSAVVVDGVRYSPVQHPELREERNQGVALPMLAVQSAELVTNDADLEWSGFSSGALAVQSKRGASQLAAHAFGSWSGDALSSSKFFDASAASQNSLMGGFQLSGPIIQDTAHFAIGLEVRRLGTPHASPWEIDNGNNAAVIAAAQNSHGVDLNAYAQPFAVQNTVISGFGRFDWQLAANHGLSVRAGFAQVGEPGGDVDVARSTVPGLAGEGSDILLSASIASKFRDTWANELRFGLTRSTRDWLTGTATGSALPSTNIVDSGAHFGLDPRIPANLDRSGFSVLESLEIPMGDHRAKFGFEVDNGSYDVTQWFGQSGEFAFGGAAQFAAAQGAFYQVTGPGGSIGFSTLRYGGFAQDSWSATPELTVVAGVRYDVEVFPADDFRLSEEWFEFTGVPIDTVDKTVGTLSPRIGFVWDVGGQGNWFVRASAGTFASSPDAQFLTELITGPRAVRRGFGALGDWPNASNQQAPQLGEMMSMAGPDYRGPLTVRTGVGISRRLGNATMLHVSGSYRSTDFLTRRTDLNLLISPAARDQHGRPIYGALQKSGELVNVARPNRRFSDFDRVSALTADGWSRYWGITFGLERDFSGSFGYFANYTYSRTTDNWLGIRNGAPDAQLTPFPEDASDWREGTSDFDLPHRLSAGVEIRPQVSLSPRIAALYSFRSGYPFTPGFREGVDVNGDGSSRNDPAFVDDAITGVSQLASSWDCLSEQRGRFAERNACRQPGVHALNARVALSISASPRLSAQVYLDAINLLESEVGEPDRALYLMNSAGGLVFDQVAGTVTLPLVANPHFGEPIARTGAGRMLRIGLQVNH